MTTYSKNVEFTTYERMIMNSVSNAVKTIESAVQSGVVSPEMVSMMLTADTFKQIVTAHDAPDKKEDVTNNTHGAGEIAVAPLSKDTGEAYDVGQILQDFLTRPAAGRDHD